MSLLESFERANEYRDKLRAIQQPVYNVARLFESPAPKVFFRSDESEHSESENSDSTEIDEVTNATHSGSFDASVQSESQIADSTEIDEAANAIQSDSFDESEIETGNESQSNVLHESDSLDNDDSNANNLSLASPSNSIYISSFSTVLVENEPNLSAHENSQRSEKDPLASIHLDASEEAAFDDIFDCANATDNEEQLQCESDLISDTPNATSHDCNDQSGKLFCIASFQ